MLRWRGRLKNSDNVRSGEGVTPKCAKGYRGRGSKIDDIERTYFMNGPIAGPIPPLATVQKRFQFCVNTKVKCMEPSKRDRDIRWSRKYTVEPTRKNY